MSIVNYAARKKPKQQFAPEEKLSLLGQMRALSTILGVALAALGVVWLVTQAILRLRRTQRKLAHGEIPSTTLSITVDAWCATQGGPAAISARQRSRLTHLIAFVRKHSPFYRALYRSLPSDIDDIKQLRPVTKPELMAHFDEWVTDPRVTLDDVRAFIADKSLIGHLYLGRYLVWTTSGSTGVPAILLQDQGALRVFTALRITRALFAWITPSNLWRVLRGRGRSAGLLVTSGHYAAIVWLEHELLSHPVRRKITRVFSVLSPLSEIVQGLNTFQPVLIGGYATAISLLAQEQMAGRLRIRPALVTTTAEWLSPVERQRIESAFGCRVQDGYGASEAGAIAFECAHGWLHVNADWIILEPVDRDYQPMPPGQPSQSVLVTNLSNLVQPIIRYDLGDSVTVKPDPCPCGSPLPAIHVEGRTDEMLTLLARDGEVVRIPPMAIATVVEETTGVRRYQIIQTSPTQLKVRLEVMPLAKNEQVWETVKQRLHAYLAGQGLSQVSIDRAAEPPVRNPRTGKFRHVWTESETIS